MGISEGCYKIFFDCNNSMISRVSYRRKHSYSTKRNRSKLINTPGGRLVIQHIAKKISLPMCPQTALTLGGLSTLRSALKKKSRKEKTVSRAYGGVLSHQAVRVRIIRAFLIDEQNIVKRMM